MNQNTTSHGWRNPCLPWLTLVLWILLSVSAWAAPEKDFTVVVLPDTQYYSEKFPKIWAAQIDWIVANRKNLNIVYVAHLGDITQNGDGKAIYDSLKGNPNLFLMLCGHNHGEVYRYESHEGMGVMTCLSDYQRAPEGGGGYLRIYRFSPAENHVHVQTFSPWLKQYKTDPANQFTFGYRMDGGPLRGLGVPRK